MNLSEQLINKLNIVEILLLNSNSKKYIKVIRFRDAPKDLQDLSQNGGDEDWIAICPPSTEQEPLWLEEGSAFGYCTVEQHKLLDGTVIHIGCHA